ncbi:unnamed protein product [Adineta steineri]|uniref:Uncharacterized protein n=1 Tax=Adineta steineri TaxID=433720 RepID=A0A814PP88_9BILA|nr:unnamed protein product [Adineta steineri]CAF3841184.1 unnamed protein product [Adineta steineri]
MYNRQHHLKPVVHAPFAAHHSHHRHVSAGHSPSPHRQHRQIQRARPPSQSIAPWDITQWVDPIQNPELVTQQ